MSEELEALKTVAQRLDTAGIPYMVTGSMALNYYAVPRMTRDIDLVVELFAGDAERLCDIFRDDFYLDRGVVRQAVETRSEVQLADVRNLLACVTELDRAYLAHWTTRLGLDGLYREVSE